LGIEWCVCLQLLEFELLVFKALRIGLFVFLNDDVLLETDWWKEIASGLWVWVGVK